MNRYSSDDLIVSGRREGLQAFMFQVYGWMCCGLALTALVAWYTSNSYEILSFVFSGKITFYGLIIIQLGLVLVLSGMIHRLSAMIATSIFMLYSMLTGLTISSILILYTQESIASAFFISAGTFAVMSLYGYTTKRDLTKIGDFLIMGLIGIVIASLVNIFWANSQLSWVISYLAVIIFVGLTAYDTQKIKAMGVNIPSDDSENMRKYAILGALTLYLDFINLFLNLLRILGSRR